MVSSTIAALLLMAATPATALQVDVGQVKLDKLPALKRSGIALPTSTMVGRVEKMLAEGKCRLAGQSGKRFDIDIPYAVLLQPNGGATRVVVSDIGCPDLESYTGFLVLEMARRGEFKGNGVNKARWFGSTLNYNLQ